MELTPSYHTLKEFIFESGEKLDELEMEYFTMGEAIRDEDGNIQNGLLFQHGWSGDYSSMKRFLEFTEPREPFDADKYFIISTTALGSPGSSSPSTSKLGKEFPQYTVEDMINAQYRLLTEQLNIGHLEGVVGTSMGGFMSLQWGVSYPDYMNFLIHIVTGPAVLGRNQATFLIRNHIIENHPDYKGGDYVENPVDAVKLVSEDMFLFAFTLPYYHKTFPEKKMLTEALHEQGLMGMELDARDVVWRNRACLSFDVRDQLEKITAKSLIVGIEGDEYFPPEIEAIPLYKSMKNAQLFVYKSDLGHLGINEIEKMKNVLISFLD